MVQPFVQVTAPPLTPYRYGLFSAAAVVDPADQREFHAGVEWEPVCPPEVPAPYTSQAASDPERSEKVLPQGVEPVRATPIRLYTGLQVDRVGRDDQLERARQALGLVEQQSLEHYVWTGAAGNRPRLADSATVVLAGSAASPLSLEAAVGELEAYLSETAGVVGVVWAPRQLAPHFVQRRLARVDGPRLVAPAGNPLVFAHTTGEGPDGQVPAAGSVWLYATGPVQVRRSTVFLPRLVDAHDRATNDVFALAERFYTVGWSCAAATVKVQLPA